MEMNKKSLACLALVSLASLSLTGCGGDNAASPVWETFFSADETEDRIDWINSLSQDSYGDLISSGQTIVPGANREANAYVAKHDSAGNLLWKNQYDINDGTFDTDDSIKDSVVDNDGNIYVAGNLYQREGAPYPYTEFLLKINQYGEQQWVRTFSEENKTWDVEFANGLIYVGGDMTRVFDTEGTLQLEINLENEAVWDVEPDALGNIYTSGHAFVAKHDSAGSLLWKVANPDNVGHWTDMVINRFDEVYVAHHSYDADRYRLVKISADGNLEWERFISEPSSSAGTFDAKPLISLDSDGNVVIVASNDYGRKLVKYSESGSVTWSKSTSGGVVRTLVIDSSNDIYIFGDGTGEKFNNNGSSIGTLSISSGTTTTTGDAIVSGDGIFVATSAQHNGSFTAYLAKFNNQ